MLITIHTANTVHDCDGMFIADFLHLDKMMATLQETKAENDKQLASMFS